MMRSTTLLIATALLTLGAFATESEAKNCRKLCRPVVKEICSEKYAGNPRFIRLCRLEGNREIIPYCRAEPAKNRCI